MNKMIKRETKQDPASIHALSHDGRGIATIDGKTTFIAGALPNEVVRYQFTNKRGSYNEALTLEVLTPANERVLPVCQHFSICGGCSQQYMNEALQLRLKEKTLLEQLQHFGNTQPATLLKPLQAQTTGYRRKARLGVRFVYKKDKLLIGFREKASRYLADISHCAVLHPKIGALLPALSALIRSLSQYEHIPQIEVAIGDEDCALVVRHLKPLPQEDKDKLQVFGDQHRIQFYLQPNPPEPLFKLWPADNNERLTYQLPDQALTFAFHPLDFTQINLEMNRLMVNQALTLLAIEPDETVLDLFCGIGNFTLPIAQLAKRVVGIEGSLEMVNRASSNAALNHITNAHFEMANLFEPPLAATWMKASYDKVLLDPPRAGAKEILPWLAKCGAKKIVYISCNPATLARDAGELVNQYGYQLIQAGTMDMFPHTSHIEAMAVFEKTQ